MAPLQSKFTVVPNAMGMQGLMSRPAGPSTKPAMTSKQAQKAYRDRTRGPRIDKAEQRRLELQEQQRIRQELGKDKQAAKARAAREKKKAKEQEVTEQKKKKGLPLVDVRPSQDTISRFLRKGGAPIKKRPSDTLSAVDEEKGVVQEESKQQGKRQCVERLEPPDPEGNPSHKQSRKSPGTSNVAPAEAPKARSEHFGPEAAQQSMSLPKPRSEKHQRPLEERVSIDFPVSLPERAPTPHPSPADSYSTSPPTTNVPPQVSPQPKPTRTDVPTGQEVEDKPAANTASRKATPQAARQPSTNPRARTEAPIVARTTSEPPKPAPMTRPSTVVSPVARALSVPAVLVLSAEADSQQVTRSPVIPAPTAIRDAEKQKADAPSPAQFLSSIKTTPMSTSRPPRPQVPQSLLSRPPLRTPGGTANTGPQRSKFLPKHLRRSPRTVFRGVTSDKPPTSTQLFLAAHIDEILPSPSQEARELQEPIPKKPLAPKFITKQAALPVRTSAAHHSKFLPQQAAPVFLSGQKQALESEALALVSTQDLCFSSQDLRDIETPTKKKDEPLSRPRAFTKPMTGVGKANQMVMGPPLLRKPADGGVQQTGMSSIVRDERHAALSPLSALANAGGTFGTCRRDITATQETDYGEFDVNDYLEVIGGKL